MLPGVRSDYGREDELAQAGSAGPSPVPRLWFHLEPPAGALAAADVQAAVVSATAAALQAAQAEAQAAADGEPQAACLLGLARAADRHAYCLKWNKSTHTGGHHWHSVCDASPTRLQRRSAPKERPRSCERLKSALSKVGMIVLWSPGGLAHGGHRAEAIVTRSMHSALSVFH